MADTHAKTAADRPPGGLRASLGGHWWTLLPHVRNVLRPGPPPTDRPWSIQVDDPAVGPVRLTGAYREVTGSDTVALLVHGLGGAADAGYCITAADAAERAGWSSLRLNLRGADGLGADLYHAGLSSDLGAAIESEALRRYTTVYVIGFSLGGHLALHHALNPAPRVAGVTAVCSPLDLSRSADAIDRKRALPYRAHVLRELKAAYRTMADRGRGPTPMVQVDRARTIRQWDAATVVPRFGFADVADYHARQSVGPRLGALRVPALYVGAPHDPMVPAFTVQPALEAARDTVTVQWEPRSGHVGFSDPAIFDRIIEWSRTAAH